MIISKIKPFKMRKFFKKAASGAKKAMKTATVEIEGNYITGVLVALDTIPQATISTAVPICNFWMS